MSHLTNTEPMQRLWKLQTFKKISGKNTALQKHNKHVKTKNVKYWQKP
jgi:hypothetical protein